MIEGRWWGQVEGEEAKTRETLDFILRMKQKQQKILGGTLKYKRKKNLMNSKVPSTIESLHYQYFTLFFTIPLIIVLGDFKGTSQALYAHP